MLKSEKRLFPLNLQHFADENDSNNGGKKNEDNNNQNNVNNSNNSGNDNNSTKTFTQDQVNSMMAKEKNEGKRSVLKSLGFANEEDAKKAIEVYNAMVNTQKTQEQLNEEALKKAEEDKQSYFSRAEEAENKLSCFQAGVNKDSIDDVLAIAKSKITDSKNLDAVLEDMKKEMKYASFFEQQKENNGTGNDPGHSGGSASGGFKDYGKRLAEQFNNQNKNNEKKSSFF